MKITDKTYFMDLETYSEVPIQHGSHAYAADKSARILLWAYALNDGPVKVWDVDREPNMPDDLRGAIHDIQSYGARHVWVNGVMFDTVFLQYRGIDLPLIKCDDVRVIAYQHALPGGLGELCKIFKLPTDVAKDKDGKRLIQKFCVPKFKNGVRNYRMKREDAPEDWDRFIEYCRRDVSSMREIYKRLPGFNNTVQEKEFQLLDVTINRRGMGVDLDLVRAAIKLADKSKDELDDKIVEKTGGAVKSVNQRQAILNHIREAYGIKLESLRSADIERYLDDPEIPEPVKDILRDRLRGAKTSKAKYKVVENCNVAGRLKGCLQFRGASRTGRLCLTGDHEVLTEHGWVRLDKWNGGRIAVWSSAGEILSFQESKAVNFDYEGVMYQYDTARCSQISTPDHRMPYLSKDGRWEVATVEQLALITRPKIPFTGVRKTPATMEHDLLRLLIMVQADGHYTPDGMLVFRFKKDRKVQRCKTLLRKSGIPFTVDRYDDGAVRIAITSRYVPLYLRIFRGKEFGYWLLNECADIIFDELPEWDGYRCGPNSIQYCTKSKHNADLIQALACLSGRTATQLVKKPQKENWADVYVINIWSTPGQGHELREKPTIIKNWRGKVYCATTPTGFFLVRREGRVWVTGNSGVKFQPQNLPRPTKGAKEIEAAIELMKADALELAYEHPSEFLSECLRGVIVASAGKRLCVADYSNVEGRVLAWLAGEEWKLKAFRDFDAGRGHDLYKLTYGRTFGVDPEKVTKELRQIGKVEELALGYGGGAGAFAQFADKFGIDFTHMAELVRKTADPEVFADSESMWDWAVEKKITAELPRDVWVACNTVKQSWRNANAQIVAFWSACETAVRSAIEMPNKSFPIRPGLYARRHANWLLLRLPSGRLLVYPAPRAPETGDITYMGNSQQARKFERIKTWGGKLAENITQAIACDLLFEAGIRLEKAGYEIVLSVHDEYICEIADDGTRNHTEMERLMSELPDWASGLPLVAAGFESYRYRKE